MVLAPMSSTCLLFVEKLQPKDKFDQRSENMQTQKKAVKRDQRVTIQSLGKVKHLQVLLKGYR